MPAVSIEYEIPSYLHKFASAEIGHPYVVKLNDHPVSRSIVRSLTGKIIQDQTLKFEKKPGMQYKKFNIVVPDRLNEIHWVWSISPETERYFIDELRTWFDSIMMRQITAFKTAEDIVLQTVSSKNKSKFPLSIKAAINHLLDEYNITEEDISVETLFKRYQRSHAKS